MQKVFFSLLLVIASYYCNSQSRNLTIQPGNGGMDVNVSSDIPESNNSTSELLRFSANSGSTIERGLLKFDLTGLQPGIEIIEARLILYGNGHDMGMPGNGVLRLINDSWTVSDVNYNLSDLLKDESMPALTLNSPSMPNENYELDVTAMVQTMVNTPLVNFGWLLHMEDETGGINKYFQFASSENTNSNLRPKLEITFCDRMRVNAYISPNIDVSNGAAHVSVTGGVPPYSYLWSNASTTSYINNIQDGLYSVTVTDSRGQSKAVLLPVPKECQTKTFTITPVGDGNFLNAMIKNESFDENSANRNYTSSNIIASNLSSVDGVTQTRSLLSFDLRAIPSNAQVTSAHLILTDDQPTQSGAFSLNLVRVSSAWNQKTGTFNSQPTLGQSTEDVISFSYDGSQATYDVDVTSHLSKMVGQVDSDNGWLLKLGDESVNTVGSGAGFKGSVGGASNGPKLVIQLVMANYACNDQTLNWNQAENYDVNGNVIHTEKTYLDKIGRRTQALVKNATNEVYRNEILFDAYGRPAIKSLPAFTGNQLRYEIGFMRNANGQIYDYSHFDAHFNKQNNADLLHTGVNNTLGNYYSNNNTYDAYQAIADNPYSRIVYSADPSSTVRKTSQPGNAFKMGSGREKTSISMTSGNELRYFYNGNGTTNSYKAKRQPANKLNCDQLTINQDIYVTKEITVSPDNMETIVYREGGKVLVTCYSGLSAAERCSNFTGIKSIMQYEGTASAEIHLPDADKTTLSLPLPINNGNATAASNISYNIIDMLTDKLLVAGVDYNILTNRSVVFTSAFLNAYVNRSLFLRISYAYASAYEATLIAASINPANAEIFYNLSYGNITRNSYDLGGLLRKTISPKAFNCSSYNNFDFYSLYTTYDYSDYGQVIASKSADEGLIEIVYDTKGNPRFSQNDKQKASNKFSYTNYDKHGRVIESGESAYNNSTNSVYFNNYYSVTTAPQLYQNTISTDVILNQQDGLVPANKSETTQISYVAPVSNSADDIPSAYTHKNQFTSFRNGQKNVVRNANSITWMNYDRFDRPTASIVQITEPDFVSHTASINDRIKTSQFSYDYFTGKTNSSTYQNNYQNEKLYLQYAYDANKRNTTTSLTYGSNSTPETLLHNYYSKSGKVKRQVIGSNLQGVDYTYTLDGNLKAINHSGLTSVMDPGGDNGNYTDVFGEIIEYYSNDYERSNTPFASSLNPANNKYNGLIHATRFKTKCISGATDVATYIDYMGAGQQIITSSSHELKFEYQYDAFHRLASSSFIRYNNQQPSLSQSYSSYSEHGVSGGPISYDKNGNILRLIREAHTGVTQDNLSYNYSGGSTSVLNNKLTSVNESALTNTNPLTNFYPVSGTAFFQYNAIGQMTYSPVDKINNITYFSDGKIKKITFLDNSTTEYEYAADGSKLKSKVYKPTPANKTAYTWYVGPYTYEYNENLSSPVFTMKHAQIPGGILRVNSGTDVSAGYPVFQLSDHLGNVRVTFKKNTAGNGLEVLSWQDYYAFGGKLPGRSWSAETYDFAFKGTEQSSDGTRWDHFPLREYDHDLGRWFAPDPYKQFHSPYQAFANNPVNYTDPSGGYVINQPYTKTDSYRKKVVNDAAFAKEFKEEQRNMGISLAPLFFANLRLLISVRHHDYHLYLSMKHQMLQEAQDKENAFFDELANNYGRDPKAYKSPGVIYRPMITREEARNRYMKLHHSTIPDQNYTRPNVAEVMANNSYDVEKSMARSSAFLDQVMFKDAFDKAVAEMELQSVLNDMKITDADYEPQVQEQADEYFLYRITGNYANDGKTLTASTSTLFFSPGNDPPVKKSDFYIAPIVGPALESGDQIVAGDYLGAAASFVISLVELFTFGYAAEARLTAAALEVSVIEGGLPNSGAIIHSVGAASKAEMLAKSLKMNINSPTTRQVLNSLDITVESFISLYRKSSVRSEIPGEFLNQTVESALRSGNTTVRKLLTENRFIK